MTGGEGGRGRVGGGAATSAAAADVCASRDSSQLEATAGIKEAIMQHLYCRIPGLHTSDKRSNFELTGGNPMESWKTLSCPLHRQRLQKIFLQLLPLLWFLEMADVPVPSYHVHCGPVPLNGAAGTL